MSFLSSIFPLLFSFFVFTVCLSSDPPTSPLWLKAFVKIWPPENGHREEMRASMKAVLDGCLWGDTGALYKHSLLSHFLFWSSSWLDGRMLELRNIIINHYHGEFLNSGSWGHPNNNNLEGLWVSNPRKKKSWSKPSLVTARSSFVSVRLCFWVSPAWIKTMFEIPKMEGSLVVSQVATWSKL